MLSRGVHPVKDVFLIAPIVMALWALAVAAYLWIAHDSVPMKDVLSTAFAGGLGTLIGRAWGRRSVVHG